MEWFIPEIAPKDGTLIIAKFRNYPTPLAAMWNGHDQEWVAASPQVEPVNGVWNDWYFENERFKHEELTAWANIDEAK